MFVFGVERETRSTLDQGAARRTADYLQMSGMSYAIETATAAGFRMGMEDHRQSGRRQESPSDAAGSHVLP